MIGRHWTSYSGPGSSGSGPTRYAPAFAAVALAALVSGCASMLTDSGPPGGCDILTAPPVTAGDADAVSDDLAEWLAGAIEICGWLGRRNDLSGQ